MLSSVLNSGRAIAVNIQVMRAFVRRRPRRMPFPGRTAALRRSRAGICIGSDFARNAHWLAAAAPIHSRLMMW
jgi:hypothetical protein